MKSTVAKINIRKAPFTHSTVSNLHLVRTESIFTGPLNIIGQIAVTSPFLLLQVLLQLEENDSYRGKSIIKTFSVGPANQHSTQARVHANLRGSSKIPGKVE